MGDRNRNYRRVVRRRAAHNATSAAVPPRHWALPGFLARAADTLGRLYWVAGLVALGTGSVVAWKVLADPEAVPTVWLTTGVGLAVAPVLYAWNVLPPREHKPSRLLRIALAAIQRVFWPIAVVAVAVLTGFVETSLVSETTRRDLTSTLNWAVLVGIVAGMGYAALTTVSLLVPVPNTHRESALRRVANFLPKGGQGRLGRAYEACVQTIAEIFVGIASTWPGIVGTWTGVGAVLWRLWTALDFTFT